MGYFVNGFVFTREPSWPAIAAATPEAIALRAYRHRSTPIWILDAWPDPQYEHSPFTTSLPDDVNLGVTLPEETTKLLQTVSKTYTEDLSDGKPYGVSWLRAAAQMSLPAGTECFCFAADDESIDMACSAAEGLLRRFVFRFELYAIEYLDGSVTVVPFDIAEDPEYNLTPEALAPLRQIPGVTVGPVRVIESGQLIHGSAVQLWPMGDPEVLLGLGTFDPFEHLDRDWEVVFERAPKASSPAPPAGAPISPPAPRVEMTAPAKRWWQFWR